MRQDQRLIILIMEGKQLQKNWKMVCIPAWAMGLIGVVEILITIRSFGLIICSLKLFLISNLRNTTRITIEVFHTGEKSLKYLKLFLLFKIPF